MSEIDIRTEQTAPVTDIVFSDPSVNTTLVAYKLTVSEQHKKRIELRDESFDDYENGLGYLIIPNKENALNLIKALNKAIELGWLK